MTDTLFTETVAEMIPTLYRVACCHLDNEEDRKDAVQEALRRGWEKRMTVRKDEYLKTWVIRILINACRDISRQRKRVIQTDPASSDQPSGLPEQERMELKIALMSLPERERIPVLLFYLEGCDVRQISEILDIPSGTVKTRLKRGREQLKAMLKEEVFE